MNRLSERDQAIIRTIVRYQQVTSGQLLRLYFSDNSPKSRKARMTRTMQRLHKWGFVARIPRPVGGWSGGSEGYIYIPTHSRARIANPHTLDITELMVKLTELSREPSIELLAYDPEVYAHETAGHIELKPDAFVRLRKPSGTFRYFVEIDRGTEWRYQLSGKLRKYTNAYKQWTEPTFPLCVWSVPDEQRARLLDSVIKRSDEPALFEIAVGDDLITKLLQ